MPLDLPASRVFSLVYPEVPATTPVLVNRFAGSFFRLSANLLPTFRMLCQCHISLRELKQLNARLFSRITGPSEDPAIGEPAADERADETTCTASAEPVSAASFGAIPYGAGAHHDGGPAGIAG